MRPGGWSVKPMLLAHEALAVRLAEDMSRLEQIGTTTATLGTHLVQLLASASRSDWFRPRRLGDFDVELHKRRGLITCPWAPEEHVACAHGLGSRPTANEFVIRRRGMSPLSGFELSAHLIRDHAFFGGMGTAFRVEPDHLAAVLGR